MSVDVPRTTRHYKWEDTTHTKAWEPPSPRANMLLPNKPPIHHIQSPRKSSLKMTPPNGENIN
jgi:hypothetical protein